jgi:hypothetical protein
VLSTLVASRTGLAYNFILSAIYTLSHSQSLFLGDKLTTWFDQEGGLLNGKVSRGSSSGESQLTETGRHGGRCTTAITSVSPYTQIRRLIHKPKPERLLLRHFLIRHVSSNCIGLIYRIEYHPHHDVDVPYPSLILRISSGIRNIAARIPC